MGKKRIIKIIINSVSLVAYHKVLYEKGEKLEAKKHLEDEIREYTQDGLKKIQLPKLNENESEEIKEKSIKRTINALRNKYPDVNFSEEDIEEQVKETMEELQL